MKKPKSKILLYHDTFLMKGGAERMNIEIAKILGADIATAYWSPECYDAKSMGFEGKIIQVNPKFKKGMTGFIVMKWRFFRSRKFLKNYDTVLFSNEAISAVWGTKKGTKTYYYAHSISRHLFDLYDSYLAKVPKFARIPYKIFAFFLRKIYTAEIKKIDTIFVNSKANQERVGKWLHRNDAKILYPPVDTNKFTPNINTNFCNKFAGVPQEFFLSFARLTHAKRVDTIIHAFKKIPEKNVIILFGAEDSQREEFMKLADIFPTKAKNTCIKSKKYPNIYFYSLENNKDLVDFIRQATATIAVSKNEDFGMVAIESMACEVPVIAVNEGGYRESIIDGETGVLLDTKNLTKNLENTIKGWDAQKTESMGASCRQQAEKYSLESFAEKLKEEIF